MALLENRVKQESNIINLIKFISFLFKKLVFVCLLFLCFVALYFRIGSNISSMLVQSAGNVISFGDVIYQGINNSIKSVYGNFYYLKDLESENLKLKLQLTKLRKEKSDIIHIQSENQALKQLLNVPRDPGKEFLAARIISMSINPISSFASVQAGSKNNVSVNDIVIGKQGLVGRVVETSENYSNIMLINDPNSRIPVITSDSKQVGILAKQGSKIKMIYFQDNEGVEVGEMIYTSGDGEIFQKGIPVAKVKALNNKEIILEFLENFSDLEFLTIEMKNKNLVEEK